MHPPAPTPTLFPCTTLFRSPERLQTGFVDVHTSSEKVLLQTEDDDAGVYELFAFHAGDYTERGVIKRDRKSTRLNSSHGYISYAVFCLKKKKDPAPTPALAT